MRLSIKLIAIISIIVSILLACSVEIFINRDSYLLKDDNDSIFFFLTVYL